MTMRRELERTDENAPSPRAMSETDRRRTYRMIPSVNELSDAPALDSWRDCVPRSLIVACARTVLDERRKAVSRESGPSPVLTLEELARWVDAKLQLEQRPRMGSVINGTGIIVHTSLGRAPLADSAVEALADVAAHYAPVELEMTSGERSKRSFVVREILCELTGAESATVVNNNAAGLLIVLATIAKGRSVIVSRGELVEIGGSFRLPEVMKAGGAVLREVGTTNKTRLKDYEQAIDDTTAAILKVHTSNYRIEGFTEAVVLADLVTLSRRHDLPVINDIGSGLLYPCDHFGIRDEPDARSTIAAGADLVLFSGDKLLGGPQAGVIVGRATRIDEIEKNPMMRAVRVDKLVMAALGATLQLHRDPTHAAKTVPVLAMLGVSVAALEGRARQLVNRLRGLEGVQTTIESVDSFMGGGSVPTRSVPSVALRLLASSISEQEFARRLRTGQPPVLPRVQGGSVSVDLRTVFARQDDDLCRAVMATVESI